ncbi:MAG: electron transfer flavoprotein subunit alpha/FixB family protein [Candidatus Atribacteria bacterium]|nr:electron transfer flavoprotein subunit alpha/FixB family protein [Candidatus Atribacteria bacterium]
MNHHLLVIGEIHRGKIDPTTYEILGATQQLRSKGIEKVGVFLGSGEIKFEEIQKPLHFGANYIYGLENPIFDELAFHVSAQLIINTIQKLKPTIIMAAATTQGTTLMPYIAAKLHTGLTADCTGFDIDPADGTLLQIRPAIGGNIMATIKTKTYPQMATVRPNTFQPVHGEYSDSMIVIEEDHVSYPSGFLYNEFIEEDHNLDIAQAKIVCSGGRGLKNSQNFSLIEELSQCLNGCVGGSRVAVEQGWISFPHQVGLSGKTISPDFYIALGISGAIQHLAGMQTSRYIIAINRDPEAQIFQLADFGIVGDVLEILPQIIKVLKQRKKNEPI